MNISHHINSRIEDLSNAGSDLADANQFDKAASKWSEALGLLPDPKSDWEAATWLLASIGDALYQQGKWDEARTALYDALNCPDGQSNPFIHYRLGQCEAKRGNPDGGVEHLLRAYMLDGDRIFLEEVDGPQYLAMLGSRGLL